MGWYFSAHNCWQAFYSVLKILSYSLSATIHEPLQTENLLGFHSPEDGAHCIQV